MTRRFFAERKRVRFFSNPALGSKTRTRTAAECRSSGGSHAHQHHHHCGPRTTTSLIPSAAVPLGLSPSSTVRPSAASPPAAARPTFVASFPRVSSLCPCPPLSPFPESRSPLPRLLRPAPQSPLCNSFFFLLLGRLVGFANARHPKIAG